MSVRYVISVDGACSGRRAACAAVIALDGRIVAERSRSLPQVDGYVLAAEIAGVVLVRDLLVNDRHSMDLIIETDNPDVPRVIQDGYRTKQASRIPTEILEAAIDFCDTHRVTFRTLPRNSTPGLRRADRLASKRLWRKRV